MKKILIFSGTTEGRTLACQLAKAKVEVTVCVATEYGSEVMPKDESIRVIQGRMKEDKMEDFLEKEGFQVVVDATHPFATEVSKNIKQSTKNKNLTYIRLQRKTKEKAMDARFFKDNESCADHLKKVEGNILLTTGSKELPTYCKIEGLKDRIFVRVLPGEESIALCKKAGLAGKQIIAMQGPFSEEMNLALLHQFKISHLVTKESGKAGGFPEKAEAAKKAKVSLCVIGNPETEEGFSYEAAIAELEKLLHTPLKVKTRIGVNLIGAGMGDEKNMTVEGAEAVQRADLVFGAKRLIEPYLSYKACYPFYLAKDIIPVLEEESVGKEELQAAVLFSGDSGFYSGASKLEEELKRYQEENDARIKLKVYPGISSFSYFASRCHVNYQDAKILSIHGKGTKENWGSWLLEEIRQEEKIFLLVSSAESVREIGELLVEQNLEQVKIRLGYQLSYQDECVKELSIKECMGITKKGLYILCILNPNPEKKILGPHHRDEEFIRAKVPMTKEEVRQLSVCRMNLTEDAIVYDIGSGTGSVAVEIASRSAGIKVYAVEQKAEAVELIRRNKEKFHVTNLEVVEGKAPDILEGLPAPTHAFIGGSSGNLEEIVMTLYRKNPKMKVVITAISLETVAKISNLLENFPVKNESTVQLQVSRAKKVGTYHLMQAENPVYLTEFEFDESREV